jgi:protocatechuate 3,4-dioxygenase beta subunit
MVLRVEEITMKSGMLILIAASAMAIGATYGAVQGPSGEAAGGGGKGASGTATAVLIPAGEPGEPLIVEGRVLSGEGGKPVADAPVYLYHTDVQGYYSAGGKDERNPGARNSRLRGDLKTDAEGRYQFRTIKPGQYPGSGPPAHIHYEITLGQKPMQGFELIFEGDSRLTPEIRQRAAKHDFFILCAPSKDTHGNLRCKGADVILK